MSDGPTSRELDDLLEQWCEERLSADGLARLEAIVTSDGAARRRYLDYVTLHGTLAWDAGMAAGVSQADTPPSPAVARPADEPLPWRPSSVTVSGRRQRQLAWGLTGTVTLAVLAVVMAAWLTPPVVRPDADVASQPAAHDSVTPAAEGALKDLSAPQPVDPVPLPAVVLDRRQTARPPGEIASLGSSPSPMSPQFPDGLPSDAATDSSIPAVVVPGPEANGAEDRAIVAFIDAELEEGWRRHELEPSIPAEDAAWLRRASLDLCGRIPDLDTLNTFVADERSEKRSAFVAQALADGTFARHYTTVWTNLLVGRSERRAAERRGVERFLLRQFTGNRPWSETVSALVSARGSVEENPAAGFLLAHLNNQAVPATAITARLFLGQQIQCTQCHKHPWNDWTQEQFWNLNAFFQQTTIERRQVQDPATGTWTRVRALTDAAIGGPTYFENLRGVMQVAYPEFAGTSIDPGQSVNRRDELARLVTSGDLQLARSFVNRMWAHFFGFGLVNPVDDLGPHQVPTHPELLDRLSREFLAHDCDVQALVRWITSARAYHLSSRPGAGNRADEPTEGTAPAFSRTYVRALSPEQVFDSLQVARAGRDAFRGDVAALHAARQDWLQQFFEPLENEENGEVSTFDGTLPQVLAMMNGDAVQAALRGEEGSTLQRVLRLRRADSERIRDIVRLTLSRDPTSQELSAFRQALQQARARHPHDPLGATVETFRDIYWVCLNTSEFVLNH
jgi:hypothetical protein